MTSPQYPSKHERRNAGRLEIDSDITFRVEDGTNGATEASGRNISAEGICISAPAGISPGTVLSMEISFPGMSGNICVKGEVRWCSRAIGADDGLFRIGIRFVDMEKQHLKLLTSYVSSKLTDTPETLIY